MHAGPEIGVASTKAFVSTLTILTLLAVHLGRMRMLSASRALEILAGAGSVAETDGINSRAGRRPSKKLAHKYAEGGAISFSWDAARCFPLRWKAH